MLELGQVKDLADWPKHRAKIETGISAILGSLPKEGPDLQLKVMDELSFPGYVRQRVNYFVDEWERVTAWQFLPEDAEDCPAVLCLHDRHPSGKDEPAGISGDPHLAFAQRLAELGYATFAPDCVTAGERVLSSRVPFDSSTWYEEHPRGSLLGKMLHDHMRALDALQECRQVDGERIGVVGHGLGGTNALLLAASDERVRVTAASCGFVPFEKDCNISRWFDDEGLVLAPKLKTAAEKKSFPFDWDDVMAMIAPNPTLLLTAQNDEAMPDARHCKAAVESASRIYSLLGSADAIKEIRHKEGHRMTFELFDAVSEWFDQWL